MNLTLLQFQSMLELALEKIKSAEEELSRLDAIAGDGDHGTAIVSAMLVLVDKSEDAVDFTSMLSDMGMGIMMQTSGSTSTLLGAFFMGMAENALGAELNVESIKTMFKGGLAGIQEQTKAVVGDKTMMDSLIPAVDAIVNSSSTDIKTIFTEGADAAKKGAESTINMKANFGRARNLGDRSVGHADPGATSWAIIFESLAEGYN